MSTTSRTRRALSVVACAVVVGAIALPAQARVMLDPTPRSASHSYSCPLTGKKTQRVKARRPAVAVKVDNSPEARPQSGLGDADVVVESLVEGGMTRLTAVYHCGQASSAGPVRSGRYDDGEMLDTFTSFLAMSGSNVPVADSLDLWGMFTVDEESAHDAMFREDSLEEPYNLFANTEALRSLAWENNVEGPDEMTFGSLPPGSKVADVIELEFSEATHVDYRWTRKGWARSQDGDAYMSDGERVYVANVLVQVVPVNESETIVDSEGVASPVMGLSGDGKAYLFRNGRVLAGRWTDHGEGAPEFKTNKGKRFTFNTGNTWYELVPSSEGQLTGKVAYH